MTFPFFGIYGASKFRGRALTDSLRYEVSQLGIDIVLVQPSAYPPMYANVQLPADTDRVAAYGAVGEIPAPCSSTSDDVQAPTPKSARRRRGNR